MTNPPNKKCINCKHRGCNINQGWAWCERQNPYFFMTDGAFCADFEEQSASITTSTTITTNNNHFEKVALTMAKMIEETN